MLSVSSLGPDGGALGTRARAKMLVVMELTSSQGKLEFRGKRKEDTIVEF